MNYCINGPIKNTMTVELEGISHVFKVRSYVVADNIVSSGPFPIGDQTLFSSASFLQFLFHMCVS